MASHDVICSMCGGAGYVHPRNSDGTINYREIKPCPSDVCVQARREVADSVRAHPAITAPDDVQVFDRRDSIDFKVSPDWARYYQSKGLMWPTCDGWCQRPETPPSEFESLCRLLKQFISNVQLSGKPKKSETIILRPPPSKTVVKYIEPQPREIPGRRIL